MTVDIRPKNAGESIQDVSARVYKLEQRSSAPVTAANLTSDPSVNSITIDGIVVGSAASPATGLTLSTGSFMEDIWIDADWLAPTDGTAESYDVEYSRKVGSSYELVGNIRTGGTSVRMSGLEPNQTYGVRVTAINRIGVRADPEPAIGFHDITTGIDATIPNQVTGVVVTPGIKTVMVTWNEVSDRDVKRGTGTYEVHLDVTSSFSAPQIVFTSATVVSFQGIASATLYYARVRAIDNSGNAGAWSSTSSATTVLANTTDIANLAVTNAKIANLAVDDAKISTLDAAKITTGTLDANRIAANSIDVNKLTASTLTSKVITIGSGGTLKIGNPPTTGIFINDQGIRLYSGSAVKVAFDVAGTATFEGTINASTITSSTLTSATINSGTITGLTVRTAASGKRIEITAGVLDQLRLYTGSASEITPGVLNVGVGTNLLEIGLFSPKVSGQNFCGITMDSRTSNTVPANIRLNTYDPSGTILGTLVLEAPTATQVGDLTVSSVRSVYLNSFPTAFGEILLKASGNYGFMYLMGGGAAATLNCNLGLGVGFHVLDGTNSSFTSIQASAFNVSSSKAVKKNIRPEGSALGRVKAMNVVRYNRVNASPMAQRLEKTDPIPPIPSFIQRNLDLEEIGLIADELLTTVPEAVMLADNGPASINLAVVLALVIKAVQELANQPGRP